MRSPQLIAALLLLVLPASYSFTTLLHRHVRVRAARPAIYMSRSLASPPEALPEEIARAIADDPWRRGLEPGREIGVTRIGPESIQGRVPSDLIGTLFRNGPGRIRIGGRKYGHWFDGDGLLTAATFTADGSVYFRQKYLQTFKLRAQEMAGGRRIETRGVWTQRDTLSGEPGGWMDNFLRIPTNPVNTNVVWMGGKVLALCEGGLPWEVDPVTLDIRGPCTFGGRIRSLFSAHPKEDPDTGCVYNHGLMYGLQNKLHVMKVSADNEMLKERSTDLPHLIMVHDSVLAGRYYVVFLHPYVLTPEGILKAAMGLGAPGWYHKWEGEMGTRVVIFDKSDLSLVQDTTIPALSTYHFINGWEVDRTEAESLLSTAATSTTAAPSTAATEGADSHATDGNRSSSIEVSVGEKGVIEVVVAKHRSSHADVEAQFGDMYNAHFTPELECEPWRYVIDVASGKLITHGPLEHAQSELGFELPVINPVMEGKRNRYAYVNSLMRNDGFLDSVSKMHLQEGGRLENHDFGPNKFAGGTWFVPRSEKAPSDTEDDGYLLTFVFDASTASSELVVIDAATLSPDGPIATIPLPIPVPHGLHGNFVHQNTFGL